MTTLGLKNVNLLSQELFKEVAEPARDELWVIEAVESYNDGSGNWYRIYPDGWCEQGGNKSISTSTTAVTLLKAFKDINYSLLLTTKATGYAFYTTKTKTNFTADVSSNATVEWVAKGYIGE